LGQRPLVMLRVRGHCSTGTKFAYDRYQEPVIIVYKVVNMDIFLAKTHSCASEGLY